MEDCIPNTLSSLEEQTSNFYSMDETRITPVQQNSPPKYLGVEANRMLTPLQTIPEFAEALDLMEIVSLYSLLKISLKLGMST